jgi:hypothetical protein
MSDFLLSPLLYRKGGWRLLCEYNWAADLKRQEDGFIAGMDLVYKAC